MTVSVQRGNPADVILAHGNSPKIRPADLIVLGAPRRRGIERLLGVVRRARGRARSGLSSRYHPRQKGAGDLFCRQPSFRAGF